MLNLLRDRWARGVVLAAAALTAAGGLAAVDAEPAAAVSTAYRVSSPETATNSTSTKTAKATCPDGYRVLGGGAYVDNGGSQVRLTTLRPEMYQVTDPSGPTVVDRYRFVATAQEPVEGYSANWSLQAFAVCAHASQLPGYDIVSTASPRGSRTFVSGARSCPAGTRAIAAGGAISGGSNEVGLHLVRTTGPMDATRATAREDANGFNGNWSLHTYAVCVNPLSGQHAAGELPAGDNGGMYCGNSGGQATEVHGPGGGGGIVDSGPAWLQTVLPYSDLSGVYTEMTATPVGGMVVSATCAH